MRLWAGAAQAKTPLKTNVQISDATAVTVRAHRAPAQHTRPTAPLNPTIIAPTALVVKPQL